MMRTLAIATALMLAALLLPAYADLQSGLAVGTHCPPYNPRHVAGPDQGTDTCPICKYGALPAVQVWINADDPKNVAAIAETLQNVVREHRGRLKAFVTFINARPDDVRKVAAEKKITDIGLMYVQGPNDSAVKEYEINTDRHVANTVFVYKDAKVQHKFVNLVADSKGLQALQEAIKDVL